MPLVLRRILWPPDGKPSAKPDYHVMMDVDTVVGRIYQSDYPGGAKWFWSINGLAIRASMCRAVPLTHSKMRKPSSAQPGMWLRSDGQA